MIVALLRLFERFDREPAWHGLRLINKLRGNAMNTCSTCQGYGWTEPTYRGNLCTACKGTGIVTDDRSREIAKQTVYQWDKHDKFRVVQGEDNGEPDEVLVARALLRVDAEYGCEVRDPCGTIWQHAAAVDAENKRLRDAITLAECQYLGCGGRNTPDETVKAMRDILQAALK